MTTQWQYQLRIDLDDEISELVRGDPDDPAIGPLADILAKHHATMKCQFDAFADYVAEAERHGTENFPLYEWTKATIEDPAKKAKYLRSFTQGGLFEGQGRRARVRHAATGRRQVGHTNFQARY